jgi:hypothetical protein
MEANTSVDNVLNEQQMLMLRLLKTPLPDADFAEIRRLAVKLLSKKLDDTIENWEESKNIDSAFYDNLAKSHFRNTSSKS